MVCYNCRSSGKYFYAEENGYDLVKCVDCGLLYVEKPPELSALSEAHAQGLHQGDVTLDVTGLYNPFAKRRYCSVLRDLFPDGVDAQGNWLDVGCGHGEFIEAVQTFRRDKTHVIGSEPNQKKQASARSRGLNVSFFDIESHDAMYRYISLLNVYSHLPDPPTFISKLRDLLEVDGELILETGDTADFAANDHYRPFYLPDHLSFASEKIVVDMLTRIGFEVVAIRKYPYGGSRSLSTVLKEFVKIFLPRYKSRLRELIGSSSSWPATDMYIRARKKAEISFLTNVTG